MSFLASFARRHGLPEPTLAVWPEGEQLEFLYSEDKKKRYAYRHTWTLKAPHVLWVMLNPGTGETEGRRRNTLERCITWSKQWGYGGLLIGNVTPVRAKSARELTKHPLEIDPLNEKALRELRRRSAETIVAWGDKGAAHARSCLHLLDEALCLAMTKHGEPRHPLFVRSTVARRPWKKLIIR